MAKLKCKICGSTDLAASEYNRAQKVLNTVLPLRPMHCDNCSNGAIYGDRLFANGWRIGFWCFLLFVLFLAVTDDLIWRSDKTSFDTEGTAIKPEISKNIVVLSVGFEPPVSLDSQGLENSEWDLIDDRPLEQSVLNALEIWRKSLEGGEHEIYFSAYSQDFKPASEDINKWKERLSNVLALRKIQRVRFNDLRMSFSADKRAVGIKFQQIYEFESQVKEGVKRMYLTLEDGKWVISAESD